MSCDATGCSCATLLITFRVEKLGIRYAAAVASQRVIPWAMAAKPRRSSEKLPITNKENVKTADNSGEEKEENKSATEQMIRNCRIMKYKATRIQACGLWNARETYNNAANTPMAMKNVLTTRVPANPKNLPTMNSHRRTGRDK